MENRLLENISLLYVEDDENIRNVFGRYLKRKIKNVLLAVNGQEGYNMYLEHKPDLVVTDINMPIMSGLEMSSIIRDENSEIPIIITSAHSDTHFFQEAINIGVNMFLLKPVDMTHLYNTIKITSEDIVLKIKAQKEEKIESNKNRMIAVTELLENIAHQWRQPLAAISAATINMNIDIKSGVYSKNKFENKIDNIDNCVQYLSSTIDSFKHFVNKDKKAVDFNVSENLNKCINIVSEILLSKNIKLVTQFEENLNSQGYPEEFVQAIINVVNNSIDAVENSIDKVVLISAKNIDDKIVINIMDSGTGINDEVINNLFEPYTTTKNKSLGSGLGLYLAYRIIKHNMAGNMYATNSKFEYKNRKYTGANIQIEF